MNMEAIGALAGELAKAGLPALAGALGGPGASAVANAIIGALAGSPATPAQPQSADDAAKVIAADPDAARAALASLEITQTAATMAAQLAQTESQRESAFSWAWRPAMSWLLIVLWSWALLILPTLKALVVPALQPIPMDNLTAFTGLWLAIYGGGNTLIRVMGKKG